MHGVEVRLFVVCGLVALINFLLFCACGLSLMRVLQAAARDAYSSPRRRLLALDDGMPRRSPSRVMAVLGAFRPFTTQKALLSMLTLSAACEFRFCLTIFCPAVGFWPLLESRPFRCVEHKLSTGRTRLNTAVGLFGSRRLSFSDNLT